jgi:hypothetical protein
MATINVTSLSDSGAGTTANQVVYKNVTNDAAGSSNFTFDGTNAVLAGSLSSSAIIGADIDGGAF